MVHYEHVVSLKWVYGLEDLTMPQYIYIIYNLNCLESQLLTLLICESKALRLFSVDYLVAGIASSALKIWILNVCGKLTHSFLWNRLKYLRRKVNLENSLQINNDNLDRIGE